ncbi:MAG: diaminopropionate ammonia-lyase [Microbacteriaceae bacterium]
MADTSVMGKWYIRPGARHFRTKSAPMGISDFHLRAPGYQQSALRECPELAQELGVGRVYVKEEASRFGLPSFKMVGASWAVYRILADRTQDPEREWTFQELADQFSDSGLTLICATDGNHGRAVAHMAKLFGLKAHVFVPAQIGKRAKEGILSEGAELTEIDAAYDHVVPVAAEAAAADENAIMVQDTAWEGYHQIPGWIVEGYATIFREIDAQLAEAGVVGPHVVVTPCGVGSLIHAAVAHYRGRDRSSKATHPSLLSVEPVDAPCLLESLKADRPIAVATGITRMAGLNCGTVSVIAWPVLRGGIDAAVSVTEDEDEKAVLDLQALGIDSGPCGAASLAGLRVALADPALRTGMGATAQSVIVLLSTESREANPLHQ